MGSGKKNENTTRVPFNWPKLRKLWDEGKSYLEMAKVLDSHFNANGDDPTKSIRAKCSLAMNKGITIDGKLVHFKRRSKPQVTKEQKPKVIAKQVPTKKTKTPVRTIAKKATAMPKNQKPKVQKPSMAIPIQPAEPAKPESPMVN